MQIVPYCASYLRHLVGLFGLFIVLTSTAAPTDSVPANFDVPGYLARNNDIAAAYANNSLAAWQHYYNYGLGEGRQFDTQFVVDEYLLLNADLKNAFGTDRQAALMHWLLYGRAEDRIGRVPVGFNVSAYLARYPDLAATFSSMTPVALRNVTVWQHYLDYGVREGRSDGDFEAYSYLATNADLAAVFGSDVEAAALHWYFYGRREGRRIPANFNVQGYRSLNPDVAVVWGNDLYGCWLHYRDTGINEGRNYDELFRVDEYLARYPDLQAAFGSNKSAALLHWLFYGKPEGRLGRTSPIALPVISSFTVDTTNTSTTGLCTLLWNVSGANSLSISPTIGTVTGKSISVNPPGNTTYTLSATNGGGTATATVVVTPGTPTLVLESAPVVNIRRDDHVATIEMDFDPSSGWGSQLWDVGTNGRDGCGYRVQWWADGSAIATILATDGCSVDASTGSSASLTATRQLVTPNRAVQLQPLANNALYHLRVERINGLGQVCSQPKITTFMGGDGTRVAALRSSLTFFDDFNLPMGQPDERKWNNAITVQTDPRYNIFFINDQCHAHTLNGTGEAAGDKSQSAQRARKTIAIENGVRRRIVFDMDGIFSPRSVWYLDFNPVQTDLTGHMSFFDMDGDKGLPADVFRLRAAGHSLSAHLINSKGESYNLGEVFLDQFGRSMSSNVRRSFDVRLGTDGVQVFVDGTSVINKTFTAGTFKPGTYDVLWSVVGYNTSKDNNPYFLSHWDNFGFDGPNVDPRPVHNYVTRLKGTDYQKASSWDNSRPTFTINVPDDIRPTTPGSTSEAWLVFTYQQNDFSQQNIAAGDHVLVNGKSFPLPQSWNNSSPLDPDLTGWGNPSTNRIKLGEVQQGGTSPLKIGNNTFQFFADSAGISNVHLEVLCPVTGEPPYTPPAALHEVPYHAGVPKIGMPATFGSIDGKDWDTIYNDADGSVTIAGPSIAGRVNVEVFVGNNSWANWAPQWLNVPATSAEIWGQGGTSGAKFVELYLRKKGDTAAGYGERIAVLTTNKDAPAPQLRYQFNLDSRRWANGDYELFVLATNNQNIKSHPTYLDSSFKFGSEGLAGAYMPLQIKIAN